VVEQVAGEVLEPGVRGYRHDGLSFAYLAGQVGVSIGWLIAISVEAVVMAPTVYQAATQTAKV